MTSGGAELLAEKYSVSRRTDQFALKANIKLKRL